MKRLAGAVCGAVDTGGRAIVFVRLPGWPRDRRMTMDTVSARALAACLVTAADKADAQAAGRGAPAVPGTEPVPPAGEGVWAVDPPQYGLVILDPSGMHVGCMSTAELGRRVVNALNEVDRCKVDREHLAAARRILARIGDELSRLELVARAEYPVNRTGPVFEDGVLSTVESIRMSLRGQR